MHNFKCLFNFYFNFRIWCFIVLLIKIKITSYSRFSYIRIWIILFKCLLMNFKTFTWLIMLAIILKQFTDVTTSWLLVMFIVIRIILLIVLFCIIFSIILLVVLFCIVLSIILLIVLFWLIDYIWFSCSLGRYNLKIIINNFVFLSTDTILDPRTFAYCVLTQS